MRIPKDRFRFRVDDLCCETIIDEPIEHGSMVNCYTSGSTTKTNSVDYAYNAQMAGLARDQQDMAEKYFRFWNASYRPVEEAQNLANLKLLPAQTELEQQTLASQQRLLPQYTGLEEEAISAERELLPFQVEAEKTGYRQSEEFGDLSNQLARQRVGLGEEVAPVRQQYFKEATEGIDPTIAKDKAQADVQHAFGLAARSLDRGRFLSGGVPASQRSEAEKRDLQIAKTKGIAGARTAAGERVETQNFERLRDASTAFGQ